MLNQFNVVVIFRSGLDRRSDRCGVSFSNNKFKMIHAFDAQRIRVSMEVNPDSQADSKAVQIMQVDGLDVRVMTEQAGSSDKGGLVHGAALP
jgi:hypothetical protein